MMRTLLLLCAGLAVAAEPVVIATAGAPRPIPAAFFGVSDAKIYQIHAERQRYRDPALLELKREMGIQAERGPCGTGSNYFLWREGVAMTSRHPGYAALFGDEQIRMVEATQDQVPVPLNRDLVLGDAAALGIPYVYCLNVFADDDDGIVASAADLVRRMPGRPVLLELGNEVYALKCRRRFPGVDDYAALVARVAPRLHALGESVRVSAVAFSPVMYAEMGLEGGAQREESARDDERTQGGRVRHWNEAIARVAGAVDAVSIHYYNRVRSFARLPTAADAMAHFFAGNAYWQRRLEGLAQVFPGTEVWATEWNVFNVAALQADDPLEKARLGISKYAGTAVVLASLELRLLASGRVGLSTPHEFHTRNGFGFVNDDAAGVPVRMPQFFTRSALIATARAFPRFIPLATPEDRRWTLEPTGVEVAFASVEAYGFGDGAALRAALVINTTGEARTVSLPGHAIRPVWSYGGADPFPCYLQPKPYTWTDPPDVIPAPAIADGPFAATAELSPWSLSVVEVDHPCGLRLPGAASAAP